MRAAFHAARGGLCRFGFVGFGVKNLSVVADTIRVCSRAETRWLERWTRSRPRCLCSPTRTWVGCLTRNAWMCCGAWNAAPARGRRSGQRVLGAWWEQREVSEFGGQHSFDVLADALHLSRAEAAKRFRTAIELAPADGFHRRTPGPRTPGDRRRLRIRFHRRCACSGDSPVVSCATCPTVWTRRPANRPRHNSPRRQPRWVRTRCARSPPDSRPTSTPTGTARNATGPGGAGSPSVIRARTR